MKHRLTIFSAFLLLAAGGYQKANAQLANYTRTVNAAGGTNNIGGNNYEWSVGEMVLVSTKTSANIIVTQGVLQPAQGGGHVADKYASRHMSVFPVPSTGIVHLQTDFASPGTLHYELTDFGGRSVVKKSLPLQGGAQKQLLNLEAYANGGYMLQVVYTDKAGTESNASFKLEKIN